MTGSTRPRRSLLITVALALALCGLTGPAFARPQPVRPEPPQAPSHVDPWLAESGVRATTPAKRDTDPLPSRRHGVVLFDCEEAGSDGQCGTLRVPLDRTHPRRASITLFFLYYRHRQPGRARSGIMISEGGPGYSLTNTQFEAPIYHDTFDPLLRTRDLIMIDQRGVGRSDVIRCRALQRNGDFTVPGILDRVAACARQLGNSADDYGSGDVALDMEAVRRALHLRRLDLYGGSYAAQDVQSYALRFPDRVRSAVLDSPFSASVFGQPGQVLDDYGTDVARGAVQVARLLCRRSLSCSREGGDVHAQLAWLTKRLRATPLHGTAYDAFGVARHVTLTEGSLGWTVLLSGDFNLIALSEVGAAAKAWRAGDPKPLLRLAAEAEGAGEGAGSDPAEIFSNGDNVARSCTDLDFPWHKAASVTTRFKQWRRAVARLPKHQFGVFSKRAWVSRPPSPVAPDPCIVWPAPEKSTPKAVPPGARFPADVPALVITGDLDLSLTTEDVRPLHRLWRGSKYVEIRNTQHHTFFTSPDCAAPIIVRFIGTHRPGDTSCAADNPDLFSYPAVGRFPRVAAGAVEATSAGSGDASTSADRKVATAAVSALTDGYRRAFSRPPGTGRGLRGGTFSIGFDDDSGNLTLHRARFVQDVAVSGEAEYGFESQAITADVTVDGPSGEDGTLRVHGVWFGFQVPTTVLTVRGTIGGRTVDLTVPAS